MRENSTEQHKGEGTECREMPQPATEAARFHLFGTEEQWLLTRIAIVLLFLETKSVHVQHELPREKSPKQVLILLSARNPRSHTSSISLVLLLTRVLLA